MTLAVATLASLTLGTVLYALLIAVIVGVVVAVCLIVLAHIGLALPMWIAGVLALLVFLLILLSGNANAAVHLAAASWS